MWLLSQQDRLAMIRRKVLLKCDFKDQEQKPVMKHAGPGKYQKTIIQIVPNHYHNVFLLKHRSQVALLFPLICSVIHSTFDKQCSTLSILLCLGPYRAKEGAAPPISLKLSRRSFNSELYTVSQVTFGQVNSPSHK